MPINPNIALSVKGLELQDPMNQFAKMAQIQNVQNQNAMAQYQLGAAQREDAVNNAMSQSYQRNFKNGVLDEDAVINDVAAAGGGSKIQGIRKGFDESRKAKTESQKAQIELGDAKLKQARGFLEGIDPTSPNAVARYKEWFAATQSDPVIQSVFKPTLEKLAASKGMSYEEFFPQYIQERAAEIEQASQDPQAFANLLNNSKLGTEKFIEMNKSTLTSQDTGDGGRIIARPGLGGPATVVEGSEFKKGISATDRAQIAISQQRANQDGARLALEREKAAREKDPEYLGQVEKAKELGRQAAKAEGKADLKTESAKQVLDLLESVDKKDPKTGKSTLDRATGSGIGALYDDFTDFFGSSTSGADAISDLRVISGKLVLRGERLGGATSDADRAFYIQSAGSLADPKVPQDRKRAALVRMREIEEKAANIEPGSSVGVDLGGGFKLRR